MAYFNQNSYTVIFYGEKVLSGQLTMVDVPNLFNLIEQVQIYIDVRQPEVAE